MNVTVARWAAWAPGLAEPEAWQRWSQAPVALAGDGTPDVGFLPPLVRRRCSGLARVLLHVAHACTADARIGPVPTVFASRHGDCAGAVELMTELANEMPITAGAFSHSVHNTAAGLHSIVTRNAQASSSTAGGDDTFGSGVVEALGLLDRSAARHTLLVVGDVPVPTLFAPLAQEPACPYAVGFLVAGGDDDDDAIDVSFEPALTARHPWPDAVELLRWLLSSEPAVSVGSRRLATRWSRRRASPSPAVRGGE